MPMKSKTRLYKIWLNMRARCSNTNHPDYIHYGARGIAVCEEWMHDYMVFENWAYSSGYREYLTIDRIDNNSGYSPDNCRWASRLEQSQNRDIVKKYEINGIFKTASEWGKTAGISPDLFRSRYKRGYRGAKLLAPVKRAHKKQ